MKYISEYYLSELFGKKTLDKNTIKFANKIAKDFLVLAERKSTDFEVWLDPFEYIPFNIKNTVKRKFVQRLHHSRPQYINGSFIGNKADDTHYNDITKFYKFFAKFGKKYERLGWRVIEHSEDGGHDYAEYALENKDGTILFMHYVYERGEFFNKRYGWKDNYVYKFQFKLLF